MTPSDWILAQASIPRLEKLRGSPEWRELARWRSGHSEQENYDAARALLEVADTLSLPPWAWFAPASSFTTWSPRSESVFLRLLGSRNSRRALALFVERGASPWPGTIDPAALEPQTEHFVPASELARAAFPARGSDRALYQRKAALSSAIAGLGWIPLSVALAFGRETLAIFEGLVEGSTPGAALLGPGDARAAESCTLMAQAAPALASSLERAAERHAISPDDALEVLALAVRARRAGVGASAWLAAKGGSDGACHDPQALARALDAPKRARLRSLGALCERVDDPEALEALCKATPWLESHPQASCLRLGSGDTLARRAVGSGMLPLLSRMLTWGSDLWLACAQDSEANAVLWACEASSAGSTRLERTKRLERSGQCAPIVARLLLGAGPPEAALARAQRACAGTRAQLLARTGNRSEELAWLSLLDSLLESEGIGAALGQPELQASCGRKRRSKAL